MSGLLLKCKFCKHKWTIMGGSMTLDELQKLINKEKISERLKDILYWTCRGASDKDISNILPLTLNTIESYQRSLKYHFKVNSRQKVIAKLFGIYCSDFDYEK